MPLLAHYSKPFLDADRIEADPAACRLALHKGRRALSLDVQEAGFDEIRQTLDELREPMSPHWSTLRQRSDGGLTDLVDWLDRLGWLGEADATGQGLLARERDTLSGIMRDSVAWLIQAADCGMMPAETLFDRLRYREALLAVANLAAGTANPRTSDERNLAGEGIRLMLERWRSTSPAARLVVQAVFLGAWRHLDAPAAAFTPDVAGLPLTMADPREVGKQLWSALTLFLLSITNRYLSDHADFVPKSNLAGPGVNVLVAAESAAEQLLAVRGESPLLGLLKRGEHTQRAAVGVYLHQYFITIRYIDALHAFLQSRLREDLRQAGTRYLLEEVGHEIHELEACHDLGVTDCELLHFAPLPFFAAYPDVLACIAEADPLAFCLAISVAEGLPGTSKPIVNALAAYGISRESLAAHQEIDERLDHALVTRRLMQHVPWVDADAARRAIQRFLFIVDLSQVCWRQLAEYAAMPALPVVPVTNQMSPRQVLQTFRSMKA